jgi:hypothetical protein
MSISAGAKRIGRTIAGFTLLLAGAAMVVLPGPGWITIALGLALLSQDFPWAQRWLDRLKTVAKEAKARVLGRSRR